MIIDQAEAEEIVLFTAKPNAFLYALEATRFGFVMLTFVFASIPLGYFKGWPMGILIFMTLFSYLVSNFVLFLGTSVIACYLTFIVTNRKAIVRFCFRKKATDKISVAIEAVNRVEMNSYDATYGSVYLESVGTSPHENSEKRVPENSLPSPTPSASNESWSLAVPIKRAASIWRSMPLSSPPLYGFYGFKRFDEFANIVSERKSVFQALRMG